jgi:glycosyltransferase involved in cell wall biosynthesis
MISVVIPLYNKKESISRALESVLSQTKMPMEIVIVNDGSTDDSEKVVEKFDQSLIKLVNQSNSGVSAARNKGIEIAKGEWIAFLDADDEWMPHQVATYLELIQNVPDAGMVATSYLNGDYKGQTSKIIIKKLNLTKEGRVVNYFEAASKSNPIIWTSAVCIKKQFIIEAGGFPVGVKSGEDLLTWAKIAVLHPIAYSTKPGAIFWQEAAHTYNEPPNRVPEYSDPVGKGLTALLPTYHRKKELRMYIAHWHKMRANIFLRQGNSMAFAECRKALFFQPGYARVYIYLLLIFLPLKTRRKLFTLLGS